MLDPLPKFYRGVCLMFILLHKPYFIKWSIKGEGIKNVQKTVHMIYVWHFKKNKSNENCLVWETTGDKNDYDIDKVLEELGGTEVNSSESNKKKRKRNTKVCNS